MVEAPRCGVQTTLGRPNKQLCVAGSSRNTSTAAPATWPDLSASHNAVSSTSSPRAQLISRMPFLVSLSVSALMMSRVLSVSGVCKVMKSARRHSSSSSTFSTPRFIARSADRYGS